MKILFVSAEVAPLAKVGGLADVAGSLPQALQRLGHDVGIVMPAYKMVEKDPRWQIKDVVSDMTIEMSPEWTKQAYVRQTHVGGVPTMLIGTDEWFNEADRSEKIYLPGCDQYLFFASAVLQALRGLEWHPDIIHCNDWHTGFVPVLMRERQPRQWQDTASIFTIHNLAYQGEFPREVLEKLNLPASLFNPHQLETYGGVNFLKAGCVYSDQVNTVSPTYAQEIQTTQYGCRLEGLMKFLRNQDRLSGILNGIDTEEFNPADDSRIARGFSAEDPAGKVSCRAALLGELGLKTIAGAPVMSVVSRLSDQKEIDLIVAAADQLLSLPAQLIVLGIGDPALAETLRKLEAKHKDRLRFVEKFDVELAQRIYAGSDIFLMPSSFEPCGLGQMIALRYGTVPLVRKTGGLADTVFEGENGFVFEHRSVLGFMEAVRRAHETFNDSTTWEALLNTALRGDYGWNQSASRYEEMYLRALENRQPERLVSNY